MRRTYISPEFRYSSINGCFNMVEESTHFGAKMLEIEDELIINDQDIIYYQRSSKEQLDYSVESAMTSIIFSPNETKRLYHSLTLDDSQNEVTKNGNTRWILEIDLKTILTQFIFAQMKKNRSFEGVKNNITIINDVDRAIEMYIESNVLSRYVLREVQLFIEYKDLRNQNVLRYKNAYEPNTINSPMLNKYERVLNTDKSNIRITFNQEKPSSTHSFNYYYNIIFDKL